MQFRRAFVGFLLLASCAGRGGGTLPTGGQGGDAHVEVACVLVPDGGLCSFTAVKRPGRRCVKLLYGVDSGTVVASDDVCSGALAAGQSSTLVVRFPSRPGDLCGAVLADCATRPVAPAEALDVATAWQAELKQRHSGPITDADCRALGEHKYEIYSHADCGGIANPIEREQCAGNVRAERDREMPGFVEDCLSYYKRPLFNCQMKARDENTMYDCESLYPY
jgi:hypothetical protein